MRNAVSSYCFWLISINVCWKVWKSCFSTFGCRCPPLRTFDTPLASKEAKNEAEESGLDVLPLKPRVEDASKELLGHRFVNHSTAGFITSCCRCWLVHWHIMSFPILIVVNFGGIWRDFRYKFYISICTIPISVQHFVNINKSSLVPRCQDVSQLCLREAQPCSGNKEPNCNGAAHMAEKPCPSNGDVDEVEGEHFAAHFEASGHYQTAHGRAPADLSR